MSERGQKKRRSSKSSRENVWDYIVQYDAQPKNLELVPGTNGIGCYVTEFAGRGMNRSGVILSNSRLIAINEISIEGCSFEQIKMMLKRAEIPMQLQLQSPIGQPNSVKSNDRDQSTNRKMRRKQRSKTKDDLKVESLRSDWMIKVDQKESKDTRERRRSAKSRRKSTGSWHMFQDPHSKRLTREDSFTRASDSSAKTKSKSRSSSSASVQMREELDYLRTSLKKIYSALSNPSPEGDGKPEIKIPFNRKYPKHFQMLEVILITARLRRSKEPDDPVPKLAVSDTDADYGEIPKPMLKKNIDQWLGRIIKELGVDQLELDSREEECVVALEAICGIKEGRDTMSNQVRHLEKLLKDVKKKKSAALRQVEEFKSKSIDVNQRVDKVVIKVLGLRNRVGSLVNGLTRVQLPRVRRLAAELGLTTIQGDYDTSSGLEKYSSKHMESLMSVLDEMVSLVRKSEVVIDGLRSDSVRNISHESVADKNQFDDFKTNPTVNLSINSQSNKEIRKQEEHLPISFRE